MAKPNDIIHIENFIQILWVEVQTRFGEFATPKDIVYHLVERGVCEPTRVRNYLILYDFDRLLVENKGHITHTFMDLSIIYDLSDRQVQGIVYKYRDKFHKNSNIKQKVKHKKKKIPKIS
jgi:hypothetical protein